MYKLTSGCVLGLQHLYEHIIEKYVIANSFENVYVISNARTEHKYITFTNIADRSIAAVIRNILEHIDKENCIDSLSNDLIEREKNLVESESLYHLRNKRFQNLFYVDSFLSDNILYDFRGDLLRLKYAESDMIKYQIMTILNEFPKYIVCDGQIEAQYNNVSLSYEQRIVACNEMLGMVIPNPANIIEYLSYLIITQIMQYSWNVYSNNMILNRSIKLDSDKAIVLFEFSSIPDQTFLDFVCAYEPVKKGLYSAINEGKTRQYLRYSDRLKLNDDVFKLKYFCNIELCLSVLKEQYDCITADYLAGLLDNNIKGSLKGVPIEYIQSPRSYLSDN